MTDLECGVAACAYWCSGLCSREKISVSGGNARKKEETGCSSYRARKERGEDRLEAAGIAGPCCEIACDAQRCVYNGDSVCEADCVRIERCGAAAPETGDETKCASFIARRS